MPGACRVPDLCTGHGCWPSRNSVSGSSNVLINDIPAFRVGDPMAVHCCPSIPECHPGNLAQGSPNVMVNDIPLGRIGDSVNCGGSMATGSSDVIIN